MLDRVFAAPGRYVQGSGALSHLARYTSAYGDTVLLVESEGGKKRLRGPLEKSRRDAPNQNFVEEIFGGECTMAEIERIAARAGEIEADLIVGLGGGKVLDTAKGAAHVADLPVMIAPTNAASDAPCSALSVVYKAEGGLDRLLKLRRNPDVVLVDNEIIVAAPEHLLAVGMGDAIATYFEMKSLFDADGPNFLGTRITLAALAIAEGCYKTLMRDGYLAFLANRAHAVTRAFEDVVEANILLSGIGFESGGTSGAHGINNGLSSNPRVVDRMHGEFVGFCTLAHLMLVGASEDALLEVASFLDRIDMPITLEQLGFAGGITPEELAFTSKVADADEAIHRIVRAVDAPTIEAAVLAADAFGRQFRSSSQGEACVS